MEQEITAILENVACLGRDAYGRYIENMTKHIINIVQAENQEIKKQFNSLLDKYQQERQKEISEVYESSVNWTTPQSLKTEIFKTATKKIENEISIIKKDFDACQLSKTK
jgi:DNA topoisomerase VI subunit B